MVCSALAPSAIRIVRIDKEHHAIVKWSSQNGTAFSQQTRTCSSYAAHTIGRVLGYWRHHGQRDVEIPAGTPQPDQPQIRPRNGAGTHRSPAAAESTCL